MRTSISLEKKTLPILSNFNQAGTIMPETSNTSSEPTWKQKLLQAFEKDTASGLQVIQNTLQNAAPENKSKYFEQIAEFFTENPALLVTIAPLLPGIMLAGDLERLFDHMNYNDPEDAFSLLHS